MTTKSQLARLVTIDFRSQFTVAIKLSDRSVVEFKGLRQISFKDFDKN